MQALRLADSCRLGFRVPRSLNVCTPFAQEATQVFKREAKKSCWDFRVNLGLRV